MPVSDRGLPSADSANLRDMVPADMLRRALKNHDRIAGSLRSGMGGPRLFKAIDDMKALKAEAAELGCYE